MDSRYHEDVQFLKDVHIDQNLSISGTITSGTWAASTISVPNGGTGRTAHAASNVLVGNGTSALNTYASFTFDGSTLNVPDVKVNGAITSNHFKMLTNTQTSIDILTIDAATNNILLNSAGQQILINSNRNAATRLHTNNSMPVYIDSGIPSTSTVSGSLVVAGGIGASGDLWCTRSNASSLKVGLATVSTALFGKGTTVLINTSQITNSSSNAGETVPSFSNTYLGVPTLCATNANVTTTIASTFHIAGAPIASTNQTLGQVYALYVESGASLISGMLHVTETIQTDAAPSLNSHVVTKGYVDPKFSAKWDTPTNAAYLSTINQNLASTSSPTFANLTVSSVTISGVSRALFSILPNSDLSLIGIGSVSTGSGQDLNLNAGGSVIINSPLVVNSTSSLSGNLNMNLHELTNVSKINGKEVGGNASDISERTFNASNNQSSPSDVTGLTFNEITVGSFIAYVNVRIQKGTPLFGQYTLQGLKKATGSWVLNITSVHDQTGVRFSILSSGGVGQIQYTSLDFTSDSWVSTLISFRAQVMNN